jgi:hypothetical protein
MMLVPPLMSVLHVQLENSQKLLVPLQTLFVCLVEQVMLHLQVRLVIANKQHVYVLQAMVVQATVIHV